ncbi:FAM206A [Bugula neritina]|uniref:FAM206A n=1 Tax=Bugula neritina TaxID=10212 RepID=A0A7J7KD75_BUGNE|nr:FAM206A [Bugula neritina]
MESQEISNEKLKQNIEPNVYEYPTVVERYYTKKYKTAVKGQNGNDFCILCHSNKLCLVTLAPSHSILREKKECTVCIFPS